MTALEYMQKQAKKHRIDYDRELNRGAPDEVLQNILKKIGYYDTAIEALKRETV